MNEGMNPVDPMSAGSPGTPMGPVNSQGGLPTGPQNSGQGSIYEDVMDRTRIYQIGLGILGTLLLIFLILFIVFAVKAGRSEGYWNEVISKKIEQRESELTDTCELEKKDIRENPWTNFTGRDDFGAPRFTVPRNWSQYEYFDINANNPYSLYFNPEMVQYDAGDGIKKNHAALEVIISKKVYTAEIKEMQEEIKSNKDVNATEDAINISNFEGMKFVYNNEDLERKVAAIILPYRDRALFIKTDDYDKWNENYYEKFYKSFVLTQ